MHGGAIIAAAAQAATALRLPWQSHEFCASGARWRSNISTCWWSAPACPASAPACICKSTARASSFAILEGRDRLGGTWDLFRYPGIRSDSDMYTLGYSFKPWEQAKAIADGPSILSYVQDTAREHGLDATSASATRSSAPPGRRADAAWTVEAERAAERARLVRLRCNFLFMCSGYYSYDAGYTPHSKASTVSPGASCTRRTGPKTSTTPASAWWSSAAAPPR